MASQDKDIEILALRHRIGVLQRQLGDTRMRFCPTDRALLAALLHRLPRQTLHRLCLLIRPDTILRWHRDLLRRNHTRRSRPKRPGRPRTIQSIRVLVLRLIWNQRHLLHALREYERFYNNHRPHQGIAPTPDHYNHCHS
jgi:putative transposase